MSWNRLWRTVMFAILIQAAMDITVNSFGEFSWWAVLRAFLVVSAAGMIPIADKPLDTPPAPR